jgi:putrescine transport system substrate-binding protein
MRLMRLGRHPVVTAIAIAALLAGCGGDKEPAGSDQAAAPPAEEKVLNVYNWTDYIAEDTLENFTKETGIKVNYDTYTENEALEAKLQAGNSGYDVVFPSASFMERQIKSGIYQPFDQAKLPNLKNMDPQIMEQAAKHDPGNTHSIVYMWGTTGIGYNVDMVRKALGEDAPVDSWALVYDPRYSSKLKSCGIAVLDAGSEIVSTVLAFLGKDPNSQSAEDFAAAEEVLMKLRPNIRVVQSTHIEPLANGQICVAVGYNGDILQARDRGAEAAKKVNIAYSLPKEGTLVWFDMAGIPKDAPHPDNAHAYIDYLMRPEVTAAITAAVNYANANAASLPLIPDETRNDPAVFPPAEVKARLFPDLSETDEFTRLLNRTWVRFKTGK